MTHAKLVRISVFTKKISKVKNKQAIFTISLLILKIIKKGEVMVQNMYVYFC